MKRLRLKFFFRIKTMPYLIRYLIIWRIKRWSFTILQQLNKFVAKKRCILGHKLIIIESRKLVINFIKKPKLHNLILLIFNIKLTFYLTIILINTHLKSRGLWLSFCLGTHHLFLS